MQSRQEQAQNQNPWCQKLMGKRNKLHNHNQKPLPVWPLACSYSPVTETKHRWETAHQMQQRDVGEYHQRSLTWSKKSEILSGPQYRRHTHQVYSSFFANQDFKEWWCFFFFFCIVSMLQSLLDLSLKALKVFLFFGWFIKRFNFLSFWLFSEISQFNYY